MDDLEKALKKQREGQRKNEEFEQALTALEERIGYTFKDRGLLRQVFTNPSFASLENNPEDRPEDNRNLESKGDEYLRNTIGDWLKTVGTDVGVKKQWAGFLNSNVYFSAIGMRLALDQCVRINKNLLPNQSYERRVRFTANALEALVEALRTDGGEEQANAFIKEHVLPSPEGTPFQKNMIAFFSDDEETVMQAFSDLTEGKATARATKMQPADGSYALGWVFGTGQRLRYMKRDYRYERRMRSTNELQKYYVRGKKYAMARAVRMAALHAFSSNPWLLWEGFQGPASLVMPRAFDAIYGENIVEVADDE